MGVLTAALSTALWKEQVFGLLQGLVQGVENCCGMAVCNLSLQSKRQVVFTVLDRYSRFCVHSTVMIFGHPHCTIHHMASHKSLVPLGCSAGSHMPWKVHLNAPPRLAVRCVGGRPMALGAAARENVGGHEARTDGTLSNILTGGVLGTAALVAQPAWADIALPQVEGVDQWLVAIGFALAVALLTVVTVGVRGSMVFVCCCSVSAMFNCVGMPPDMFCMQHHTHWCMQHTHWFAHHTPLFAHPAHHNQVAYLSIASWLDSRAENSDRKLFSVQDADRLVLVLYTHYDNTYTVTHTMTHSAILCHSHRRYDAAMKSFQDTPNGNGKAAPKKKKKQAVKGKGFGGR